MGTLFYSFKIQNGAGCNSIIRHITFELKRLHFDLHLRRFRFKLVICHIETKVALRVFNNYIILGIHFRIFLKMTNNVQGAKFSQGISFFQT